MLTILGPANLMTAIAIYTHLWFGHSFLTASIVLRKLCSIAT